MSRMAFKQSKTNAQRLSQEWNAWIDQHRCELASIGLPPELYLDAGRWSDFLENGHLHWHESSGFEFGQLSKGQLAALRRFLEREYGDGVRCPPLLCWVRVRLRTA